MLLTSILCVPLAVGLLCLFARPRAVLEWLNIAGFAAVLAHARVWVNGQPAEPATPVGDEDVVAVLPPVSGGAAAAAGVTGPPVVERATEPVIELVTEAVAEPVTEPMTDRAEEEAAGPVVPAEPARPPEWPRARPRLSFEETLEGALARQPAPEIRPERPVHRPAAPPPLAVVPDIDRPHVRLGLLWAAVTSLMTLAGRVPLALWFAVVAAIAAGQAARAWHRRGDRPSQPAAMLAAAALPLAALGGVRWITAVVAATIAGSLLSRLSVAEPGAVRRMGLTYVIAFPVGLAAASPVLLRDVGLAAPFVLLGMAALYDAGSYLVGTGASSAWEGPAAGVAALVPVTIVVAVVLVPPFRGASPLLLGLVAAGLAPLGPLAGSIILGDRDSSAPALRRLDSLILLGPVWAWVAVALIR